MKKLLLLGTIGATMLLGGCVAVPYDGYGYGAVPAYGTPYYAPYGAVDSAYVYPAIGVGVGVGYYRGWGWGRGGGWHGH
ncbi:hypothetical protein [Glaciimonas soli]|uniref:Lipoprotein n=1 Tax=Glaciimonas soli TaxID=2590999 RepID=A0A843YVV7_9BURK|nr:hypothetical protein [Glaciimonas soli]MQR01362.1 hypothetical protein [Glaciimonas soli]